MQYRRMGKTKDSVSVLGYGCMRFPRKNGKIDEKRTEAQIIRAIEQGVNYFDTAYTYHGGRSESILGGIIAKGYRDRVKLATKLPPFLVNSAGDMERILENQLKRLCTDYIDYYLLHALSSFSDWCRLKGLGVLSFIDKARREGRIIYIGFSFHGDKEDFKAIVDDYCWDFCQIQYNYIDENFQAGREGLEYAASKGLGVIVMEPLRGGSLTGRIPREVQSIWNTAKIKRSPADWALRWLWDQPEVTVVLSGMNEESHIDENIKIAREVIPGSLTGEEKILYDKVKEQYKRLMKVSCTGCGYCMPCPAGVDIPLCFSYYNTLNLFKARSARWQYIAFAGAPMSGKPSYASLCMNCGKCEKLCPQRIPIREKLKDVAKEMEPPVLKPIMRLARKYYTLRKRKQGV